MVLVQQAGIDFGTYVAFVLANPEEPWELYRGRLREKPGMSMDHNRDQTRLVWQLNRQIELRDFEVRPNSARLRAPSGAIFMPDVAVVPVALADALSGLERRLETYDRPLPFVVELWSPSTGDHDVDTKFGEYRARGDAESWRRQADGSYHESHYTGGSLTLWALPNVTIDLDALLR